MSPAHEHEDTSSSTRALRAARCKSKGLSQKKACCRQKKACFVQKDFLPAAAAERLACFLPAAAERLPARRRKACLPPTRRSRKVCYLPAAERSCGLARFLTTNSSRSSRSSDTWCAAAAAAAAAATAATAQVLISVVRPCTHSRRTAAAATTALTRCCLHFRVWPPPLQRQHKS